MENGKKVLVTRLIDADKFLKDILTAGIGKTIIEYSESDIGYMIRKRPTIDAVPVVRCRDCFYYKPVNDKIGKCVFLIGEHQYVVPDGYCYLGERKEGAE